MNAEGELPQLKAVDWNHVQLRFREVRLELFVNRQLVYSGEIAAVRNDRTFGLFQDEGDFDMTTAFEALNIAPTNHGLCNAMLQIALTDEPISHHAASMVTIVDPGRFP